MTDFETAVNIFIAEGKVGPGVVAIAIDKNGNITLSKTAGKESINPDANPISSSSVFRLASATKLISTIAILRFISRGHATLDDPQIIEKHLPELCAQQVITSAPGEPFTYEARRNPITLRNLLCHTAGTGLDLMEPLMSWRKAQGQGPKSYSGPVPECYETPLLFQPDEGWNYGAGQDWAGVLISRVTGQKFSEWLKENVCKVLDMDEDKIGFDKDELEKGGDKVVMPVVRGEDGKLHEQHMPPFDGEAAGGGLMCSVDNYVKVLADIISEEPKILPKDMIEELFKPLLPPGSKSHDALVAGAQIFNAMTGPLSEGLEPSRLNHGLAGVVITGDSPVLGETKGTICWGGAFNWVWWANRDLGSAGVFATGMWPPGEHNSGELQRAFVKEAWK